MSEYLHCNQCYEQPGNGKIYHLTNCGHIYCEICSKRGNGQCYICQRPCNITLLGGKLKPEIEFFFTDRLTLLKKLQKQVQQVYQVFEFQQSHQNRLNEYRRKKTLEVSKNDINQSGLEQKLTKAYAQIQNLSQENQHLKTQMNKMKQYIDQIRMVQTKTEEIKPQRGNEFLSSDDKYHLSNNDPHLKHMKEVPLFKPTPYCGVTTTMRDDHTLKTRSHFHNTGLMTDPSINDSRDKLYTPNNNRLQCSPNSMYLQSVKSNKSNHSAMSYQSNGSMTDNRSLQMGHMRSGNYLRRPYIKANDNQPIKNKISSDFIIKLPAIFDLPTLRK